MFFIFDLQKYYKLSVFLQIQKHKYFISYVSILFECQREIFNDENSYNIVHEANHEWS